MGFIASLGEMSQYLCIIALYMASYLSIENGCPQLMFIIVYVMVPWLDEKLAYDLRNPTPEQSRELARDLTFKFPLYLAVFADWVFMFYLINYICVNQLNYFDLFFVLAIGATMGGSNINVGHELFHKDNPVDKLTGMFTYAKCFYMHFIIEHVFGHHRNVATPKDPATARLGESLYSFYFRSIIGSYMSAWTLECKRVKAIYGIQNPLNQYNRMLWQSFPTITRFNVLYLILLGIFYLLHGVNGVFWFIVHGFTSILILETINYIEHYGLLRQEVSSGSILSKNQGVYEPVDIRHSWNAPQTVSNLLLFKLQRHSDHHENPIKPYQTLCTFNQSPCLPSGFSYPVCLLLSMFPQVWFATLDPHLKDYQKNKGALTSPKTKAKIHQFLTRVSIFGAVSVLLSFIV